VILRQKASSQRYNKPRFMCEGNKKADKNWYKLYAKEFAVSAQTGFV
jgi:hypothetical protein